MEIGNQMQYHKIETNYDHNWAAAWDYQQFDIFTSVVSTSLCSLQLSLKTSNGGQSVA